MDLTIFIFFVLPLATILLAIVFQKILRSPILVALAFFAIYLIVAFVSFADTLAEALIAVIIYTIIAYITALIVMFICRCKRRFCMPLTSTLSSQNTLNQRNCSCGGNDNDENDDNIGNENNLLRISCRCGNSDQSNDLLTVDSRCFANDINNNTSKINAITDATNISEPALATTNKYVGNAAMYGNAGRGRSNVLQNRLYRRY